VIFSVKLYVCFVISLSVDWILTFDLWCCVYSGFRFLTGVYWCCKLTCCINTFYLCCSLLFCALFGFSYLAVLWCVSSYWWSYSVLIVTVCPTKAVLLGGDGVT
jgi:hypothetical protein